MALWQDGSVIIEEGKFHYYRTGGEKPPIVLLHGFTDNGMCWARVAEGLEADYDLIMPDARGHGLSVDFPSNKFTLKDMAIDLIKFIKKLGLKTPILIGHNVGARVATYVSAATPTLVSKVVAEDPGWNVKMFSQTRLDRYMRADVFRNKIRTWKTQSQQHIIAEFRRDQSLNWHKTDYMTWADAKMQLSVNTIGVMQSEPVPLEEIIPKIVCPMLLVWGDAGLGAVQDEVTAQKIQEMNPKIEIARISGAGQDLHRDKLEPFLQKVKAFLSQ